MLNQLVQLLIGGVFMTNKVKQKNGLFQTRYIAYYIAAFIELLLIIQLTLKFLGGDPENGFVKLIYSVSGVFISPFPVFEPATFMAIVVYALIALGITKIIDFFLPRKK